ncbi:hypothetical protein K7432_006186 [Basidiobolus ranarum]|uniref:G-protein coupled receptors family 1 profile domain-containing protein n=1 Tax=Basidiobolus ranarum TaxID=34480 RepID=A0ABR2W210_9FUNG
MLNTFTGVSLFGSGISCFSCLIALLLASPTRSLRHMLVVSLLLTDFVAYGNEFVSSLLSIYYTGLPTTYCKINGLIETLTSEGSDFTILGIALVTFVCLRNPLPWLQNTSRLQQNRVFVFVAIWTYPVLLTTILAVNNMFSQVSETWCWISSEPEWVRLVFGSGIQVLIFLAISVLYSFLFVHLNHAQSFLRSMEDSFACITDEICDGNTEDTYNSSSAPTELGIIASPQASYSPDAIDTKSQNEYFYSPPPKEASTLMCPAINRSKINIVTNTTSSAKKLLKTMRLMSLYPIVYIILWCPLIVYRILQMLGYTSPNLEYLLLVKVFIGAANAILYGCTEDVRHQLKVKLNRIQKILKY